MIRFSTSRLLPSLCAVLLAVTPFLLSAQVNVVGSGKVNVSVASLSGDNGSSATSVLKGDLERTSLISTTSPDATLVASGGYSGGVLSGTLTDKGVGKQLLSKTYSGDWRSAAHQFADDITLATTGVPGFATSKVAFIAADTGQKELYVMDIDGANIRRLTSDKTISNGPAWSKDGSMVAYTSYKSGYPDVYVVKMANLSRTKVAFFPGINTGPSFSPDGSTLALTLSKDGNPEIYTMPVTGGATTRLTRTRGAESSPCWSPSGEKIVYTSDDRGSVQLYIMNSTDGSDVQRVPTESGYSSEPDWSPDGKYVAYSSLFGKSFYVSVYEIATGRNTQVTLDPGEDPSWTSNSRHLVYTRGGHIYVLDSVTKRSVQIHNNLTKCSEAAVSR